jgi:hypothetical protein
MAFTTSILQTFQNPATIAASFENGKEAYTPLLDWFFPEAKRKDHPFVGITMEMFTNTLKNVPHSGRGVEGYAVEGKSLAFTDFEPKPVVQVINVLATELRNLDQIQNEDAQAKFIGRWTNVLKNQTLLTIEAMLATFLSGSGTMTITKNQPMGFVTETFAYGTLPSVTTSTKWDAAGATVADIMATLADMHQQIVDNGYGGGGVEFICGKDAWQSVVEKVESYTATVNVRPDGPVQFGPGKAYANLYGYIIKPIIGTYVSYSAAGVQSSTNLVDPDLVYAKAMDGDESLFYCALDRADGAVQARLQIDVEPAKRKLVLESESKPFPLFDTKSLAQSDVMT